MAEVILDQVSKLYGSVVAVDRVSLTIRNNEFVTLVGPSGCGKTTTLNMIAGLIELTSGTIKIGTKIVNDLDPKDRDIAMVFQNYALYPHKTVYQNLEFPLRMRGVEKTARHAQVTRAAEILGITALLERKPRQLSGGQQQRVAVGRALVRDPAVFLMDEPLSNLDAKLRVHMRAELKVLQERLGATVIYVTHDQLEAMTMSDKVAVMNGGRLQQYGTPDEVFHHPANTFVAGFMGSPPMNLLPANIEYEAGVPTLVGAGDMRMRLKSERLQAQLQTAPNRSVIVGIRHTAIPIVTNGASENAIPVEIYTVEPTGDTTFVHVRIGEQLVTSSTNDLQFSGRTGERIHIQFDENHIHLFDAETTQALQN
ncbi:MAG: ABC transporter ATP-binding protein [Chloroflexota bacterium]|nr:ABC transporter ATP-binding protein [Chloroflexota bacterium]